ncbi:MAG TPA: hypothetical protein PKM72_10625 [Nitrospirales bacterium]|nr:hypothetical protein [Nitrospiraceae bacterium]HNP61287.1 hypothetical protein [Nitrospirales bacterium]
MNSPKDSERSYLLRFKELCPEFPDGSIEDSESPDFLVHGSHGTVGIELTAVYRPDPIDKNAHLPAIEKEREKIVEKIKHYYIHIEDVPLRVSFLFSGNVTNKSDIKNEDLKEMATLIHSFKPQIGETVYLDIENNLPFWVDRVSITTREPDGQNFWTAQKCVWIPELSPIEIQREINKKEEKHISYLEKCSFAWLVLMSQVGEGLGTHVKFSNGVWSHRYETLFEQVWIFQNPNCARKLEVV